MEKGRLNDNNQIEKIQSVTRGQIVKLGHIRYEIEMMGIDKHLHLVVLVKILNPTFKDRPYATWLRYPINKCSEVGFNFINLGWSTHFAGNYDLTQQEGYRNFFSRLGKKSKVKKAIKGEENGNS